MNIPGLIALAVGTVCVCIHFANYFGKRKARCATLLESEVIDSHVSEWRSSSSGDSPTSTSHIVKTLFNVPAQGTMSHTRHFGTRVDADEWSSRFCKSTWHPVIPHPYAPGEVFLKEELLTQSYSVLIIGIVVLFTGALMSYFD